MTEIGAREDRYEQQARRSQAEIDELLSKTKGGRKLSDTGKGKLRAVKRYATPAQQDRIDALLGWADRGSTQTYDDARKAREGFDPRRQATGDQVTVAEVQAALDRATRNTFAYLDDLLADLD